MPIRAKKNRQLGFFSAQSSVKQSLAIYFEMFTELSHVGPFQIIRI
jgi:hypothetical protein